LSTLSWGLNFKVLLMEWLLCLLLPSSLGISTVPKTAFTLIPQFGFFTPCEYYAFKFQIHSPETHSFLPKEIFKKSETKTKTNFLIFFFGLMGRDFWVLISQRGYPSNIQDLNRELNWFKGPTATSVPLVKTPRAWDQYSIENHS